MKTNIICLLMLLLFMVAACGKDDPASIPEPQPESIKKYLKKVSVIGRDSLYYEVINCTWDSLHRIKTYRSNASATVLSFTFHYDSIGRVSRIDHNYDLPIFYGLTYYYLCNWKNEKELNYIDIYNFDYRDETISYHLLRYTYLYDQLGRITRIESSNSWIYQIGWDGFNITTAGIDYPSLVENQKFDKNNSPWSAFPNMFIILLSIDRVPKLAYDPSKNNPIQGGGFFALGNNKYEYDYDKDGYPIHQYYLLEDGSRLLYYIFEYF